MQLHDAPNIYYVRWSNGGSHDDISKQYYELDRTRWVHNRQRIYLLAQLLQVNSFPLAYFSKE